MMKRIVLASCIIFVACSSPDKAFVDNSPLPAVGGGLVDSTALACEPLVLPSANYGNISAVLPGNGKQMLWSDFISKQFMVTDPTGNQQVFGRQGDGDGQFQLIGAMGWSGDDIWISDVRQRRVQYFGANGSFKRAVSLGQGSLVWSPGSDGRFLGLASKPPADTLWAVIAMEEGKSAVDTIGTWSSPPVDEISIPVPGGRSYRALSPFANHTWVVRSDDGRRWCGAAPQPSAHLQVKCVTDTGQPIFDTTLVLTPRVVTPAVYDSILGSMVRMYQADLGELLKLLPPDSPLPLINGMKVDTRGDVWINLSHSKETGGRWMRIRRDGAVRDTLLIPTRLSPKGLRNDTIWSADVSAKEQQPVVVRCVVRG